MRIFDTIIMGLIVAGASSIANAEMTTLVPVRNVTLDTISGCGQPHPSGKPCSAETEVVLLFTVASGGTCHKYDASITQAGSKSSLSIWDTAIENCTRPEIQDYAVTVRVVNGRGEGPLVIANPLYVKHHFRP